MSFGEVFIRAHTKSDGTFSDFKAKQVIEAFKKQKEAQLATLETDDHTETGQHPPLSIEEENELFIQVGFLTQHFLFCIHNSLSLVIDIVLLVIACYRPLSPMTWGKFMALEA